AEEVAGGVHARDFVEGDQPGAGFAGRARLIEPDVPGAPDAQKLYVDPAGLLNPPLVLLTEGVDAVVRQHAARDVGVRGVGIDLIEEVLLHEAAVALEGPG